MHVPVLYALSQVEFCANELSELFWNPLVDDIVACLHFSIMLFHFLLRRK